MSVCIAALAKGGTRMVIAVDRLGSLYGGTFEAEDTMTKGSTLVTARWTALFAGDDVSRALPVIQRAREALDALGTVPSRDKVADIMLREYQRERSALATEQHLSVYRMDMQEFLSNGGNIFGDAGFAAFRERIEQTALGCDFLCAGFNERGQGSIFSVEHPGVVKHFDSIGYWAIGSGAYNALSHLAIRGQKAGNSVVSTVYNVFEGKVAAESS